MTTRSALPPGVSAITFSVRPLCETAFTATVAGAPLAWFPSARSETSTTGMSTPGPASVPLGTPRRVRTVSETTSALAPARSALRALSRKKQMPRSTSGISRGPSAAKSACEQPVPAERRRPATRPEPE